MSEEQKETLKEEPTEQTEKTEKTEPTAEEEYTSGWKDAGKLLDENSGKELSETTPDAKEKAEDAPDPREKALKDTKAWATKLAQENAELRRIVDSFSKGNASIGDVRDAQENFDKAREMLYEDYPEFRDVLEPLIRDIVEIKSKKQEESMHEHFERHIKPQIVAVHPDFDSIVITEKDGKKVANEEYFAWAEKQRPSLRFAAIQSNDAEDIIYAITEYKKFKASPDVESFKRKQEKQIKDKFTNTQTLRGGSTPFPAGAKKGNPDDYDSGWEEAEAILKKQGIL
jgi:hypothetical protein